MIPYENYATCDIKTKGEVIMKRRSINSKVKKAAALIASLSVAACQFSAVMPANAAETEEPQSAIVTETDEAQPEKADETDEAQSEKADETDKSEKLRAEPCLSVDKIVLPASAAGSRVKVNVYINDDNMGSSKYYQQPDVYIDIDRRLQYCGFRNGMKDGTKGIGLQGEMYINAKHKRTLRFYSEKGLGANGTFAVIEVEIPKDAQPGTLYYFNICDAGGNITKVSIPETDDIAGETDKPLKTADTSDDKYLKDTPYDGYILIDPESESDNPQTEEKYVTVSEDELEYDVYEDHAEVIFCQYEADKAVIKPEINGKKVTAIADYAFAGTNITSVEIPDTVTSIGDHAFANSKLASLELPDSVTSIGSFAFTWTPLESIELPGSLVNIGECVFEDSKLKSAVLHEGIETVGRNVFRACRSLSELKLPSTLKEISTGMCEECRCLTEIEIPSGVTAIGNAAFEYTAITTARIPEGVKKIGSFAFADCAALEHVFLPSGLESIGDCAFNRCLLLKSIELPDTLKSIASDVFGETRITKIDIPASVTEIEENAFLYSGINTINYADELETLPDNAYSGAEKMKTVKLPSKLTAIPDFCFDRCALLSSVDIPETVTSIGRYAFSGCGVKELVIPDIVNTLEEGTFSCSHLTSVTIPDSITELPDKLFEGSDIKTVKLPSGLKVITEDMFYSCNSLAEVDIPVSVTEIQSNAFAETPLSSLYIPESVTKIAADAFWHSKIETIYGVKGSYAETFAKEQGIRFAEKSAETKAKAGDVNCDDTVDMADAVLIMQALANPNKYGIDGSDEKALTEQGAKNGDVDTDAAGLTSNDALKIQQFLLGIVKSL